MLTGSASQLPTSGSATATATANVNLNGKENAGADMAGDAKCREAAEKARSVAEVGHQARLAFCELMVSLLKHYRSYFRLPTGPDDPSVFNTDAFLRDCADSKRVLTHPSPPPPFRSFPLGLAPAAREAH
jgi:hypothetical protein